MSNHDLIFLNYLAKVFDNLDDSIMLFAVDGDTFEPLLVNNGFYKLIGQAKDNPKDILKKLSKTWKATPSLDELCAESLRTKDTVEQRVVTEYPPEGRIVSQTKIIPVLNSLAEITHLVVISQNITNIEAKDARIAELEQLLQQAQKAK